MNIALALLIFLQGYAWGFLLGPVGILPAVAFGFLLALLADHEKKGSE